MFGPTPIEFSTLCIGQLAGIGLSPLRRYDERDQRARLLVPIEGHPLIG